MKFMKTLCLFTTAILIITITTTNIVVVGAKENANLNNCLKATSDVQFFICHFCKNNLLNYISNQKDAKVATDMCSSSDSNNNNNSTTYEQLDIISSTIISYGNLHGYYWNNASLTKLCLTHLIQFMPRRDTILMYGQLDVFLEYLFQHIRYAILSRTKGPSFLNAKEIPIEIFLDYVLPYSFLNEKRDLTFKWRSRFYQLFHHNISKLENITSAMHYIASEIPSSFISGYLQVDGNAELGDPISWESETSPMNLSPQQVVEHHGSCTGTAITMAAAARSVGIPIRIAGCSQSIEGDDHHWTEYYEPNVIGPFKDFWHTKEGTSNGNAGGPWDALSEPMEKCLGYLIAKDPKKLNTIYASQYSGKENMILQWGGYTYDGYVYDHVGGVNRCGAYCTKWGCGQKHDQFYNQMECGV